MSLSSVCRVVCDGCHSLRGVLRERILVLTAIAEIVRFRGALMIPVSGTINGSIHDEGVHLATSDIHFKRILVGIDFSKQAALALKTAIAIGEIFGSEIFLVN